MFQKRLKLKPDQNIFYLITNKMSIERNLLGASDKTYFRNILMLGQERLAYVVRDYVILDDHYHLLIEVPSVEDMHEEELIRRWARYYKLNSLINPGKGVLNGFNYKIHDISMIISNLQQRFTHWYNRQHSRKGKLFERRFCSDIIEPKQSLTQSMIYLTLNPVRNHLTKNPVDYRWCGFSERKKNGCLHKSERDLAKYLANDLGLPENSLIGDNRLVMDRIWSRFHEKLINEASGKLN